MPDGVESLVVGVSPLKGPLFGHHVDGRWIGTTYRGEGRAWIATAPHGCEHAICKSQDDAVGWLAAQSVPVRQRRGRAGARPRSISPARS